MARRNELPQTDLTLNNGSVARFSYEDDWNRNVYEIDWKDKTIEILKRNSSCKL